MTKVVFSFESQTATLIFFCTISWKNLELIVPSMIAICAGPEAPTPNHNTPYTWSRQRLKCWYAVFFFIFKYSIAAVFADTLQRAETVPDLLHFFILCLAFD